MKSFCLLALLVFLVTSVHAQVSINNTGSPPDPNAMLDISSNSKGLLIPRMDSTARKAIPNVAGMVVFDTTMNSIFVNDGLGWRKSKHYIGEKYGGGSVFWVDTTGEHGLIASPKELSSDGLIATCYNFYSLSNMPAYLFLQNTGVFAGEINTAMIVAHQDLNQTSAAQYCINYSVMENNITYGGWYLPSRDECLLLVGALPKIGGVLAGSCLGYWTSTFVPGFSTQAYYILGSLAYMGSLNTQHRVRPIRRF